MTRRTRSSTRIQADRPIPVTSNAHRSNLRLRQPGLPPRLEQLVQQGELLRLGVVLCLDLRLPQRFPDECLMRHHPLVPPSSARVRTSTPFSQALPEVSVVSVPPNAN